MSSCILSLLCYTCFREQVEGKIMCKEKQYNYVYEIVYPNGMKYIGVRSCDCELIEDSYLGSGFYIPETIKPLGIKYILSVYPTRMEAMQEEIRIHALLDIKYHPDYYNRCNSTSTKFQVTQEAIERGALKRIGRTKESHEYVANQAIAMSKYKGKENRTPAQLKNDLDPVRLKAHSEKLKLLKGDNQTEAQKAGRLKQAETIRGTKNPLKGHPGTTSSSFIPWYYIEPNGNKHEMHAITKKDFAKELGLAIHIVMHRFDPLTMHKVVRKGPLKGYIFGNLVI